MEKILYKDLSWVSVEAAIGLYKPPAAGFPGRECMGDPGAPGFGCLIRIVLIDIDPVFH